MLRQYRGACSQDVWRPIDFSIATIVSASSLLLPHLWDRLLAIRSLLLLHPSAFALLCGVGHYTHLW